jgi:formate hydrogenlyase subunit 3/multisubunit Na+/H+ antiporter MnhD subunit
MTWLLLLILAVPLVIASLIVAGGWLRRAGLALAPFAAAPALLVALPRDPTEPVTYSWLLLGAILGVDQVGQVLVLLTAVLWTVAGVYARAYHRDDPGRHRFFVFYLLTMTGNLGLVLALDAVTFYTAFALMTFAAYGLVVHSGSPEARRAGRVYIVMAVIGEGFLLAGLVLAVRAGDVSFEFLPQAIVDSRYRDLIIALLIAGFGIKAGAIPLHVWLPLAHPVAPTPASAVLSGVMIKAGLLGWLRFLPLGVDELRTWGAIIVAISLAAAFFGVLIGITQVDPKTTLAYSSISQMGLINSVVGVGLAAPDAWPIALAGCLVYVLHHGLMKGALFLGVGVAHAAQPVQRRQRLIVTGLAVAAISLAGVPLTTGAMAKAALKAGIYEGPAGWFVWLEWLLPLAAVGTTVLMARFLWLIWRIEMASEPAADDRGLWIPWAGLIAGAFLAVWVAPTYYRLPVSPREAFVAENLWTSTWPALIGIALAGAAWWLVTHTPAKTRPIVVPAGDLLVPIEWMLGRLRPPGPHEIIPQPPDPLETIGSRWYGLFAESHPRDRTDRLSRLLARWEVAGALFLFVLGTLTLLMLGS